MTPFWTLVARGYYLSPTPIAESWYLLDRAAGGGAGDAAVVDLDEAVARLGAFARGGIAAMCPTYVSRCPREQFPGVIAALIDQLPELERLCPDVPILYVIAITHDPGERDEARWRLAATRRLFDASRRTRCAGVMVEARGKLHGVNAVIRLVSRLGVRGLAMVDDDTRFSPGCIGRIVRRFLDKGGRGAVGGTVIAEPEPHWSARLLVRVRGDLQPAKPYPYACCMVIEMAVVANGVPQRYGIDDGFIFFELLAPARADALEWLEVIPDAWCWTPIGRSSAKATVKRLKSALLSHALLMADYPHKARYYRRHMLFYGLWPIGALARGLRPVAALKKWLLKSVFFVWFARVWSELLLRGLFKRPLTRGVNWATHRLTRPPASSS